MKRRLPQSGFTIVELLIVVVIIAILAAIVSLTASGIALSARNAKTAAAVSQYKTALESYVREHGHYPPATQPVCLGTGYADVDENGTGDCWHLAWPTQENDEFNDALRSYLGGTLPAANTNILHLEDFDHVGATYFYEDYLMLDGQHHNWMLSYTIEGKDAQCPVGPVLTMTSWPEFTSAKPESGYSESFGDAGVGCWIALPDPSKL